jgi:hypothetical protein
MVGSVSISMPLAEDGLEEKNAEKSTALGHGSVLVQGQRAFIISSPSHRLSL